VKTTTRLPRQAWDRYKESTQDTIAFAGSNGVVLLVGSGTMSVRDVIARNITANRTNQGAGVKISEPYEVRQQQSTLFLHLIFPMKNDRLPRQAQGKQHETPKGLCSHRL
jgi:hypothetical protein